MSFVDELHEKEMAQRKEASEKRLMRDSKLLNAVVDAVKNTCDWKVRYGKDRKINGFYNSLSLDDYGSAFREDKSKFEIPNRFSISDHYGDRTRWCLAFSIDDPEAFERLLNAELINLGFNSYLSSPSILIPRQDQEFIGTSIWGSPKYKLTGTISYTIWVNISW